MRIVQHTHATRSGFTLIELMIVVAILGILTAIAVPTFVTYLRRAKTAEAAEQLKTMFKAASVYYEQERPASGLAAAAMSKCAVETGKTDNYGDPRGQKTAVMPSRSANANKASFDALGFALETGYYAYDIGTVASGCTLEANQPRYTLAAIGDLDDDGTNSRFELAVGSNAENELYHAAGVHVIDETE